MLCKECDCQIDPANGYCREHGGVERQRAEQNAQAAEIRRTLADKWSGRDPKGFSPRRFYRGRDTRWYRGRAWNQWIPPEIRTVNQEMRSSGEAFEENAA